MYEQQPSTSQAICIKTPRGVNHAWLFWVSQGTDFPFRAEAPNRVETMLWAGINRMDSNS
jgi:hypothetical protein